MSRLEGFVVGVFVEVLWDVERTNTGGRRQGERTTESVWWRGEVLEVKKDTGCTTAQIRYDPMGEFQAQVGDVRVFPRHLQVSDKGETTQLKWRYYESSGYVIYDMEQPPQDTDMLVQYQCLEDDAKDMHIAALEDKLEEISVRFEQVEKLVLSQRDICSRISGSEPESQSSCDRVFALLRHKLAAIAQKPLLTYKQRSEEAEISTVFDFSIAASMRTSVDCTIEEFETICRAVKLSCATASFRVDGRRFSPNIGSLAAHVSDGEILFHSLYELCRALGVCQETDFMNIAMRERSSGRKGSVDDSAVRIAGTYLADGDRNDTPTAVLICRGIYEGMKGEQTIDVLVREDTQLDPRTVWYSHALRKQKMSLTSLLQLVYPGNTRFCQNVPCSSGRMSKGIDPGCFRCDGKHFPLLTRGFGHERWLCVQTL